MRIPMLSPLVLALAIAHGAQAAPLTDVRPQDLRLDVDARGEITTANRMNLSDGSRSAVFRVRLAAGQAVRLELSGSLRGRLAVLDDGTFVAGAEGRGLTYRSERGGEVLVAVSGADGDAYGPFVLRATEQATYAGGPLRPGMDVSDWMQGGGSKHYVLEIAEPALYTIDMASTEFDSVLELSGPSGRFSDDDSGEGSLDARITAVLEPGTYALEAKSYGSGGGQFSLTLAERALPEGVSLQGGGVLPLDGSTVTGFATQSGTEYTLTLSERAALTVDMRSSEVDSYLELSGEGVSINDDDGGGGLDARIGTVLGPGTYTVKARSFSNDAGMFTLSATLGEVPADIGGGELRVGTPHETILMPGARDAYSFSIRRAGNYVIDMTSDAIDSMLSLHRDGEEIASDDDGGDGLNSRISMRLERGSYTLYARALGSRSGAYTVSVRAE